MKDFFISFNSADQTWAEWIAWQLEEGDYEVVIQAWDFLPGENFVIEMQKSILIRSRFPGVLPPNWKGPRHHINFIGREKILMNLHQSLTEGKPIAICGLGGVGKTQIALEYVYKYISEYQIVWWIRS